MNLKDWCATVGLEIINSMNRPRTKTNEGQKIVDTVKASLGLGLLGMADPETAQKIIRKTTENTYLNRERL